MADKIRITTPEYVELEYTISGIGSRFIAMLLDGLIQFGILIIGYLVLAIGGFGSTLNDSLSQLRFFDSVIVAVFLLFLFLVFWGYFIFFEVRWNGQTPGKRAAGIRVIRDSGHPIDFRSSLIRNLVRIVDMLPGFYAIGFMVMFFDKHWKRLGDMAAGTMVVQEAKKIDTQPTVQSAASKALDAASYSFLDNQALLHLSKLSRQDYHVVQRFMDRRPQLDRATEHRLANNIAHSIQSKLELSQPISQPVLFLEEIQKAYKSLHGE